MATNAKDVASTSEAAIRMARVTKSFGLKNAVSELSLVINTGSVYGLIGPNGAGKTTTFSMLAGYLKPSDGTVEVLGFAPSNVDALRGKLGVLPQDALLPASDTVGEFLVDMARLQGIAGADVLRQVKDVLNEVDGSTWWSTRCGALSHGMAKRVQLAQALLGDPQVVLLDEPTAGLDPRVAYEVREIIKGRKGRCTIVVSSHNLAELEEVCDGAAILDLGRLVASGSIADLTATTEQVRFRIPALKSDVLAEVRTAPSVTIAEYDDERRELIVHFDKSQAETDAESVIAVVLPVLLKHRVRISGVAKGQGLEQRVMDLTDRPR